ncbi:Piso0_004265 [Millerozyma farinosa CBS 7064]|uniref:Vacuolar ATPase assembly protein VMA22 n=1 Tax=Pichia sorbitophila (strain ATCC MYA-4447 / BCRC 22081 / CBS 7064 / NBRC 10061 / NRRL Y-12695) TaxID=559304 RepID=G8YB16_PICSO|nr:Piso0_004265 [Millerozyma farinosa CBS 7064]CCE84711.1 Piso0_004265 [Millerozyma farinosa CBS 7064]
MVSSEKGLEQVFEDLTIEKKNLGLEEVCIPKSQKKVGSEIDQKTLKLLQLLDQYEKITKDSAIAYMNGNLTLSRANYNENPLIKKYGMTSYDYRPYNSCKKIRIDKNGFELIDLLSVKRNSKIEQTSTISHSEASSSTGGSTKDTDIDEDKLKNRKAKNQEKQIQRSAITEFSSEDVKDPIYQFGGGLGSYQLRQSQKFYSEAVNQSIALLNIKRQIDSIIDEIKSLSG